MFYEDITTMGHPASTAQQKKDMKIIIKNQVRLSLNSTESKDVDRPCDKPKPFTELPIRSLALPKNYLATRLLEQARAKEEQLEGELTQLRAARLQLEQADRRSTRRQLSKLLNQSTANTVPPTAPEPPKTAEVSETVQPTKAAESCAKVSKTVTHLPIFNGAPRKWLVFHEAYTDSAPFYSDEENVKRLRRCLKGAARKTVLGLLESNASPDEMIEMLSFHFGQPQTTPSAELARLDNLRRVGGNAECMYTFANEVYAVMTTLCKLEGQYYCCPQYIEVFVEKMYRDLRDSWYVYTAGQLGGEPVLMQVARFLQREPYRLD